MTFEDQDAAEAAALPLSRWHGPITGVGSLAGSHRALVVWPSHQAAPSRVRRRRDNPGRQ